MSKTKKASAPPRPIQQITAELYHRLGCADAPKGTVSRLLEEIDDTAERMEGRIAELESEPRLRVVSVEQGAFRPIEDD